MQSVYSSENGDASGRKFMLMGHVVASIRADLQFSDALHELLAYSPGDQHLEIVMLTDERRLVRDLVDRQSHRQ